MSFIPQFILYPKITVKEICENAKVMSYQKAAGEAIQLAQVYLYSAKNGVEPLEDAESDFINSYESYEVLKRAVGDQEITLADELIEFFKQEGLY